ncbi:class I SAM-dependent DNA methyltransferase [Thalassiella azotivora]
MSTDAAPPDLEAVRASYERVADRYVELGLDNLSPHPWLRAVLTAFAEEVRDLGPVLDVGCGPGHVSAFLADLGVEVSGVDLSPRMVEHARRRRPDLDFTVASATELDLPSAGLGGVLAWWSLFHLPRPALETVVTDLAGALVPGGVLLVGTHVGDGDVVRSEAYDGVPVDWTTHLWQPDDLAAVLTAAGLEDVVRVQWPPKPPQRAQVVLAGRRPPA